MHISYSDMYSNKITYFAICIRRIYIYSVTYCTLNFEGVQENTSLIFLHKEHLEFVFEE